MKTGKSCPSSYKSLQKKKNPNLRNYIFAILKDNTVKLGLFTNFKVLFSAVSMVLRYLAYIEISDYRDKGLLVCGCHSGTSPVWVSNSFCRLQTTEGTRDRPAQQWPGN